MIENTDINILNVYELRNFAKSYGVKSPSKMTKQELLDNIKKINCGEIEPTFTSKGKIPFVTRQTYYDILKLVNELKSLLINNEKLEESYFDYYKNNLSSNSEVESIVKIYDFKDFIIIFDDLIRNSFQANVKEIKNGIYKLDFESQSVIVSIQEENK